MFLPPYRYCRGQQRPACRHQNQAATAPICGVDLHLDQTTPLERFERDDQGALRRQVNVFVNGELVRDRARLSDPVGANDDIYVFQALTGG